MKTEAIILDRRDDGGSQCYLCRINLSNYVEGLPPTYKDYDVQREVVANVYLDRLVDTVLNRRHIPPIVLVVATGQYHIKGDRLDIESFKILDGLQRTFRLQAIKLTIDFCLKNIRDNEVDSLLKDTKFKFSRQFSSALRELESDTNILRAILEKRLKFGTEALRDIYLTSGQWFEVWVGLSPNEEVQKMLTLNAGHKPVKMRHQLEILFLNILPFLRSGATSEFRLVREKELSATQFSKNRTCGSFHFAHLITAVLSLSAGRPVAATTGLIQGIQENDPDIEEYGPLMEPGFLQELVLFLLNIDQLITRQYGALGTTWLGREVTLSGLFGAIGAHASHEKGFSASMSRFQEIISDDPGILNLKEYEHSRNNLDLSKVNIGNANRRAIYDAMKQMLQEPYPTAINWLEKFL